MSTWSQHRHHRPPRVLVRIRTRSFVIGTLLLVAGVVPSPSCRWSSGGSTRRDPTRIAVAAAEPGLADSAAASIAALLNASSAATGVPAQNATDYVITAVGDRGRGPRRDGGRRLDRPARRRARASGESLFMLYTDENAGGRTATLSARRRPRSRSADRLDRLGVAPGDRATLFAPAEVEVPGRTPPRRGRRRSSGRHRPGHARLRHDDPDLHDDHHVRELGRHERGRGEVLAGHGGDPQRRHPVPAPGGQGARRRCRGLTQYVAVMAAGLVSLLLQAPVTSIVAGEAARRP